jgi:hypothetical protein
MSRWKDYVPSEYKQRQLPKIPYQLPELPNNQFTDINGKDVFVLMKVPVKEYIKEKSVWRKISHRTYEVKEVNYSQMKRDEQTVRNRVTKNHRRHQERVSH